MAHHSIASERVTAASDCTVEQTWSGRIAVLSVAGALDMLTADTLQGAVDAALGAQPSALIVDLTAVEFLGSAGMSVLISTSDATGVDLPFAVVAHGPATARPLALTGITEIIAVYATLPDALLSTQE